MKNRVPGIVSLFLLVSLLTAVGCGAKKERLSVAGSTSVQPIAEVLAEEYMSTEPKRVINVQGGGSSAGIKAVKDGTAEIGTSSRLLKPDEKTGLTAVEIALDGIAIVTHPDNPVKDLSMEQLRKIYSGEIKNWSKVGGKDAEIMVVNREEGSGTRTAFIDIVMGDTTLGTKSIVQGSTGAVRQSVSSDLKAIGYISLAALNSSVKTIRINGVPCTYENIKQKKYAVIRPFLFIYKQPAANGVQDFINYVLDEGQRFVRKNGLIAVK
ncbi:MAG TPA: phosphate ABC transporter substrate-binding protein [Bacillota bacterium]|nr:phosphate ABC transporter substrate-binding protein [Bacillota bacterium]